MVEVVDMGLAVAVVFAIVEIVKRVSKDKINAGILPVIAVLVGVVIGLTYFDGELKMKVFNGVIAGLTASGLFDQTKITQVFKKDE